MPASDNVGLSLITFFYDVDGGGERRNGGG